MTFPLVGLFSHTPYLLIVLLIFRSHNSSDDHSLSFSTYSSSVHTPLFICSHLWLIHGLCALPALNSVPIYSGRQSLSFCRFCQLRILLWFSPNTTLVPSDSDFSLVPSCSHWGQGPKYPPGTCWIHWEYRQQVTPMCPVGIGWVHFKCPLP